MKVWKWLAAIAAIVLLWFMREAIGVLFALVLLSATIAYIASPLARFFEERVSRKWGPMLAFIVFLLIVAGWIVSFVPMMVKQAVSVGEALPALWDNVTALVGEWQDRLRGFGLPEDLMLSIGEQLGQIGISLLDGIREKAMGMAGWIASISWIALSPVMAYYFLRDRRRVFSLIERWIPSGIRPLIVTIASSSREAIGQYVRGQVIVSIITGILTAVGLLIAGLPSWLLMGFFMMIFNLIPYFGPVLGAVPILLLATAQGWGMIVKCLVVIVAAQQLEALLITPRILSSAADLHPVVVVAALFIGGSVGGLAGMVFVIPVVLIVRVVMERLLEYRLRWLCRREEGET